MLIPREHDTFAVRSTFLTSNIRYILSAHGIHVNWANKLRCSSQILGAFLSPASAPYPVHPFGSFLLSPSPCSHRPPLTPCHHLFCLGNFNSLLSALPSLALFLCILYWSAWLKIAKPKQIGSFCGLTSFLQLLLSCSWVTCVVCSFLFPSNPQLMPPPPCSPCHSHIVLQVHLSFFNNQAPFHLIWIFFLLPIAHFLPHSFQLKSPVFKHTFLIHLIN